MKLTNIFKKKATKKHTDGFADFFLYASDKEKIKVFEKAARQANEDQRKLIKNINKLQHEAT
jgi:hypothetical protein